MTPEEKALKEQGAKIEAKSKELKAIFDAAKTEDGRYDFPPEKLDDVRKRNEELEDLNKAYEADMWKVKAERDNEARLATLAEGVNHLGHVVTPTGQIVRKSLGEAITEQVDYKNYDKNSQRGMSFELPDVDMKTEMTTSAGIAPQSPITGLYVFSAQRTPTVADLIPTDNVSTSHVTFYEETTFTNNAAAVAESGTKPESALAFTLRDKTCKKIAATLPVTMEQLDDVAQAQGIINNRLLLMLRLAEETEIISGDGTGAHLLGFLNTPSIQTQARGADNNVDAIFKLFTKLRATGFAEPSAVVIHPSNWETVRLMKTTDGIYIWGAPSESGLDRVWGKQAVVTTAITANTALAGDFALYSHISRLRGVRFEVGWINDQFVQNAKTMLIEERLSLEVYRAAAFGTATSLN